MTINHAIMQRIHGCNIYDGFPAANYPLDLNNWQSQHVFFAENIIEFKPKLIIELGSWKGGSAAHMGGLVRQEGLPCAIICVDTWLGHWYWWAEKQTGSFSSGRTLWDEVATKHGWPTVYFQFLANMVHTGNQDIVVPVPQTTTHALAMFKHLQIVPDMVYVDADHDYEPVYRDIVDAWALLPPGGVMIGDDYYDEYPGVIKAVDQFAREQGGLRIKTWAPNKWRLIKP